MTWGDRRWKTGVSVTSALICDIATLYLCSKEVKIKNHPLFHSPSSIYGHLKMLRPNVVDQVEVTKSYQLLKVHRPVRILIRRPHQGLEDCPGVCKRAITDKTQWVSERPWKGFQKWREIVSESLFHLENWFQRFVFWAISVFMFIDGLVGTSLGSSICASHLRFGVQSGSSEVDMKSWNKRCTCFNLSLI